LFFFSGLISASFGHFSKFQHARKGNHETVEVLLGANMEVNAVDKAGQDQELVHGSL
jgi:hypothetical protein